MSKKWPDDMDHQTSGTVGRFNSFTSEEGHAYGTHPLGEGEFVKGANERQTAWRHHARL